MFDNLRQKSAEQAEFLNDDAPTPPAGKPPKPPKAPKARRTGSSAGGSVGITPAQRFLLALMLFLNVTVLGCFALIVFEKIALPLF